MLPIVGSGSARTVQDRRANPPERADPFRSGEQMVLTLTDPRATDAVLTGAKAANLALAGAAGLPVIPGFVVTTATFDPAAPGWPDQPLPEALDTVLRAEWSCLADDRKTLLPIVGSGSARTVQDRRANSPERADPFRSGEPMVLALTDPRATDAGLTGAKAANLALAGAAGLPVIPGFVVTTATFDPAAPGWPDQPLPEALDAVLRAAWSGLGWRRGRPGGAVVLDGGGRGFLVHGRPVPVLPGRGGLGRVRGGCP